MGGAPVVEAGTRHTANTGGARARVARWFESLLSVWDDIHDTVASWWTARFPGGPSVPLEDVKRRYGL